ncbi:hypothetical protein H0H93_000364 [Arthromyces matolae]|nr:hypothetical protein H0H93_000364 [Arthromyces matolae]
MTCEDIPYVDPPPPIPAPETRICAIEINKISGDQLRLRWITSGWDLIFTGTKVKDIPPPSTMLFDFHFGLSCYKRWGVLDSKDFLRTYRRDHYENIPVVYSAFQAPEDDHDDSSALEDGITMEESMDHIMWLMLELRGLTPEVRKEMAQRRQEEEQLKSRQKVMEWMEASEPGVAESPPEDTH